MGHSVSGNTHHPDNEDVKECWVLSEPLVYITRNRPPDGLPGTDHSP